VRGETIAGHHAPPLLSRRAKQEMRGRRVWEGTWRIPPRGMQTSHLNLESHISVFSLPPSVAFCKRASRGPMAWRWTVPGAVSLGRLRSVNVGRQSDNLQLCKVCAIRSGSAIERSKTCSCLEISRQSCYWICRSMLSMPSTCCLSLSLLPVKRFRGPVHRNRRRRGLLRQRSNIRNVRGHGLAGTHPIGAGGGTGLIPKNQWNYSYSPLDYSVERVRWGCLSSIGSILVLCTVTGQ
jgi:hypothetical protein